MPSFDILDRRGGNKPEEPAAPVKTEDFTDKSSWKEVAYGMTIAPINNALIICARAFGLRCDEKAFCADYWIAGKWTEGFDWTPIAKKRLDTFLGCSCNSAGACAIHQMYVKQWMEQDYQRMALEQQEEPPEVVKIFIKAEEARAKIAQRLAPRPKG